jgi:hypothetical protein
LGVGMKLINKRTGRKIVNEIEKLSDYLDKAIGLLSDKFCNSLFFQTRFGIHTFGLKKPITVIICDDSFRIVKIKYKLTPNRIFIWNPKFRNVIELPYSNYRIKNGDRLKLA